MHPLAGIREQARDDEGDEHAPLDSDVGGVVDHAIEDQCADPQAGRDDEPAVIGGKLERPAVATREHEREDARCDEEDRGLDEGQRRDADDRLARGRLPRRHDGPVVPRQDHRQQERRRCAHDKALAVIQPAVRSGQPR